MTHFLFALTMLTQHSPSVVAAQPCLTFVEPTQLRLTSPTLALFTHCSRHFDPLGEAQAGVRRTARTVKAARFPVIYLHDSRNPANPGWKYMYDDWTPLAYLPSDIGHFEMNFAAVEHVICLGGFYGQCERATVADAVRLWYRDGLQHNLRLTQVTDGTFSVGQHVKFEDPYADRVREYHYGVLKARDPKAVITVEQIISRIADPELIANFLQRQLPNVPVDVNVVMDAFGIITPLQVIGPDAPVLTFAYRRSDNLLTFDEPIVDWDGPVKKMARHPSPALEYFPSPSNAIRPGSSEPFRQR